MAHVASHNLTDEQIYAAYCDQSRTVAEIAADMGCHPVVLSRWGVAAADRLGKPRRRKHSRVTPAARARLLERLAAGVLVEEAAAEAGVSRQYARSMAADAGLAGRDGRTYAHAVDLTAPSEGVLRWLGYLVADGANTGKELVVYAGGTTATEIDTARSRLLALREGVGSDRPLGEKPARHGDGVLLEMRIAGRGLCSQAAELGVVKAHQSHEDLDVSPVLTASVAFWSGFVAGNGWVGRDRRTPGVLRLQVVGHRSVLEALGVSLHEQGGVSTRVYAGSGGRRPRLYVVRGDVAMACDLLGMEPR